METYLQSKYLWVIGNSLGHAEHLLQWSARHESCGFRAGLDAPRWTVCSAALDKSRRKRRMSNYSNTDRVVIDKDVLPIFIVEKTDPIEIVSFEGTGFLMGKNLFITCWPCITSTLPPTQYYAAVVKNHNGEAALALAYRRLRFRSISTAPLAQ